MLNSSAPVDQVRAFVLARIAEALAGRCLHRVDEHALRAADRPNRLQAAFTDAVVYRATRHAEQLGGVVERNAAADTRFETGVGTVVSQCHGVPQKMPA